MRTVALTLLFAAACATAQVKLPQYTRTVLPNGVVVDLMPKPGVPLVGIQVLIKGGAEAEPAGLEGVAGITADLLRKGTTKLNADEFSDQLDALGGSFRTRSDYSSTVITSEFLKKDFDLGLELVNQAVLRPTFPEAEVKKLLAQRLDAVKAVKDNPQGAIGLYYQSFFYGPNHPYGHPADETSLGRMKRADLEAFHKTNYCGKNIVVIVSGEFDSAAVQSKITSVFGSIPAGSAIEWKPAPAPDAKTRLLLVDKSDATQTYFYIGQPGVDRKTPDRAKLLILNTLFGGRFTSMLNEALRVNSGLTYGANSRVQQTRLPGSIMITTFTKTETTTQAIDMALDILKGLGEKGITAEQLASAQGLHQGHLPAAEPRNGRPALGRAGGPRTLRSGPLRDRQPVPADRRRDARPGQRGGQEVFQVHRPDLHPARQREQDPRRHPQVLRFHHRDPDSSPGIPEVATRARAARSLSSSTRFLSIPQRYPPNSPVPRITRWHGMASATSFDAQARATARVAFGSPIARATSE